MDDVVFLFCCTSHAMDFGPTAGRPEKDPEDRRSRHVTIRVCPSHKEIIKQEADRRNSSMTHVVVRIGLEEISPSGRLISLPSVWEWLLDKAAGYRDVADGPFSDDLFVDLKPFEFRRRAHFVSLRQEKRERLWSDATGERRDQKIGVRLKPGRLSWIESRAEQRGTSRSGLLRAHALEGIDKRDRMAQVAAWLSKCEERGDALVQKKHEGRISPGKLRDKIFAFARKIEETVEKWQRST